VGSKRDGPMDLVGGIRKYGLSYSHYHDKGFSVAASDNGLFSVAGRWRDA
jgi:hypothetical protein